MQMEKELNHVPRREIDRSVEVLHFVAGEDSSRRCSASGAPSTVEHRWRCSASTLPARGRRFSDGRAVLDVFLSV